MEKIKQFFHHLLIPAETNNYKPKSLQTDFLMIYLITAFLMSFVFKKIDLTNILGFATDITIDKLYQLTNQEREKNHLPPLNYNEKLASAAYQKAQDMFAKNYWAHFAPDGKTPWDFILNSGYSYEYAGENLAKNFLFSDGVISAWMNSPTHRENILKSTYTDIGFAVVNGVLNGEETTLIVQMFGKPNTSSIAKQPEVNNQKINFNQPVEAEEIEKNSQPMVLSKNTSHFAFNINIIFFSFLLLALILDFYFVAKFRIIRISGKTLSHIIFITFIIIGLIIISKGAII